MQTTIDHDLGGYGQTNEFHLSIPVMDFKTSRKFNMEQGNRIVALLSSAFEISLASLGLTDRDVKFAFTEKGLAINQQTSPF